MRHAVWASPHRKCTANVTGTVTYTINFAVYTGSTSYWTIRYVVTAPGKFEYVPSSLMKLE